MFSQKCYLWLFCDASRHQLHMCAFNKYPFSCAHTAWIPTAIKKMHLPFQEKEPWFHFCPGLITVINSLRKLKRFEILSPCLIQNYIFQIGKGNFFVFQTTAVAMAISVRERFFVGVMEPQLMQTYVVFFIAKKDQFLSAPCHLLMSLFCVQFRDWDSHFHCTFASHCPSSHFRCLSAWDCLLHPWRAEGARKTDRHQQAPITTSLNWALWSHFRWGKKL